MTGANNLPQQQQASSKVHLGSQQLDHLPVLLQVLTHGPEQLRWVQLECCKGSHQQRDLLAVLALAELQGAALQQVRG